MIHRRFTNERSQTIGRSHDKIGMIADVDRLQQTIAFQSETDTGIGLWAQERRVRLVELLV